MNQDVIRALAAAFIGLLLLMRIRTVTGSYRRRAFGLGALTFGLLAAVNLMGESTLSYPLMITACISLLASLAFLVLAYRRGELRDQLQRASQTIAEERRKRADEATRKSR